MVCGYVYNVKYILKSWCGGSHLYSQQRQRQRQVDLPEFKISLVYKASSKPTRATQIDRDSYVPTC